MYSIGVDIGAMSIKIGLVDEYGKILYKSSFKTNKNPKKAIDSIAYQIKDLLKDNNTSIQDIKGIGIGCPGAVNSKTGVIDFLPNLDWENIEIVKMLKEYFDTDIKISNDANVATLGEVVYGSAKNLNSAIMFTLGTGVGGGIVIDKKLFEGEQSRGAELGHTTLVLDGEQCSCGRKGCVECYASATALIKQTKNAMEQNKSSKMWDLVGGDINNVDGKTAFESAKQGDKTANEVVDKYVYYLGESILNMLNIFRPEAFIIGGGISNEGDFLINKLISHCEKQNYGYKDAPKTQILRATLGNDAGIIGASVLVR
ncbi:MAG: ROK family protein [Clostridiales bacterium]|nr:ROK family protein [Clostridiales bacterium]